MDLPGLIFTFATAGMLSSGAGPRTFCNPLPIEGYPLGVHRRGLANGTVSEKERETWLTADGKTRQFRELADPALLCVEKSWYLYPSAEMCYRSDDGGASWSVTKRCLCTVGDWK